MNDYSESRAVSKDLQIQIRSLAALDATQGTRLRLKGKLSSLSQYINRLEATVDYYEAALRDLGGMDAVLAKGARNLDLPYKEMLK